MVGSLELPPSVASGDTFYFVSRWRSYPEGKAIGGVVGCVAYLDDAVSAHDYGMGHAAACPYGGLWAGTAWGEMGM